MRRTLLPAAAVLLAPTSCASEEDGELPGTRRVTCRGRVR